MRDSDRPHIVQDGSVRAVSRWLFADCGYTDADWNELSDDAHDRWDQKARGLIFLVNSLEFPDGSNVPETRVNDARVSAALDRARTP